MKPFHIPEMNYLQCSESAGTEPSWEQSEQDEGDFLPYGSAASYHQLQ